MKNTYLGQAWLVIALALAFGLALAAVQVTLSPRVERNKLNDALSQVPSLVPGATRGEQAEIGGLRVFKAFDASGKHLGWVVPARGLGFADVIALLVGVDGAAERITGLYVLEQKETPGLGDFITSGPKYRDQFTGKPAARPLVAVKRKPASDAEIEAITGATISSQSVVSILNAEMARFRQALAAASAAAGGTGGSGS